METCLKCKYRSECEEHYGKIGEEGGGLHCLGRYSPMQSFLETVL